MATRIRPVDDQQHTDDTVTYARQLNDRLWLAYGDAHGGRAPHSIGVAKHMVECFCTV